MTFARSNNAQFDAIAGFALDPGLAIPEDALRHSATLLIDTLGVAAGATALEVGQIARNHAVAYHAAGADAAAAHMLFDGRRVSLPGAAWALGTQIDNLDGHDGFNPVKGHIGCAVVPALCAFAERHPDLTGHQALTAMTIAYEIAARAGLSLHATVSDYHTSGAWNALGVAALGCRLESAGADTLRQALGIAEYHGPRSQMMREIDNPTMLHDGSGMGAMIGSMAALLAKDGFTGAPALTAETAEVAHFWADLGHRWTVAENYIKPYPSCRWGHAAIDALRNLMRDEGVTANNAVAIDIHTFDEAARLYSGVPATTSQAQYSINFVMAVMLRTGTVSPQSIAEIGLRDPDIAALIPRITAHVSDRHNATFPASRISDVTVTLSDGRVVASGDVTARGGPGAWMDDSEIEEKFHLFCADALDETRTRAIWAMRDRLLDPGVKFSDLLALVHPAGACA